MQYLKANQTKKTKAKRSERKVLVDRLDTLILVVLRKRDTLCCSCGKAVNEASQVSHYVTRRVHALRWDLKNVHMSCPGCNIQHNHNPIPYTQFMLANYGKEVLDELFEKKNRIKKLTISDLREIEKELNALI